DDDEDERGADEVIGGGHTASVRPRPIYVVNPRAEPWVEPSPPESSRPRITCSPIGVKPSFRLTARIAAFCSAFEVVTRVTPRAAAALNAMAFTADARPLPRYSLRVPVNPCCARSPAMRI